MSTGLHFILEVLESRQASLGSHRAMNNLWSFFLHPIGFVSSEASRQSVLLRSCSGEVRSYKAAVDRCGRKREATESSGEICTNRGADQTPLGRSLSRCTISCPISTPQLQTKKGGDPTVNFVPRANDIYIVYI